MTNYQESLSPIERNVLHLKMQGQSHGEIAQVLEISVASVGKHMSHVRMKMHAQNSAQAVARYLGWKGLSDE